MNKGILHGTPQFAITGKIDSTNGNQYTINGDTFIINKNTVIYGDLKNDSYVEIRGNLVQGKPKIAKQVTVADNSNEQTDRKSTKNKSSNFPSLDEINANSR